MRARSPSCDRGWNLQSNAALALAAALAVVARPAAADESRLHEIQARLDVPSHRIEVVDRVRVAGEDVRFLLNRDLLIEDLSACGNPVEWTEASGWDPRHFWKHPPYEELSAFSIVREIQVALPDAARDGCVLELRYGGVIADSLHAPERAYGRGFETTYGRIVDQGAYLTGATFWLPWFGDELIRFDLTVDTPVEWRVVSQGHLGEDGEDGARRRTRWISDDSMEDAYLIAGPYRVRERDAGDVRVLTYCYENTGDDITDRYLDATGPILDRYGALFGAYPYSKFALVENYWQTGYGMPSFTFLGDRVIRLPFIVDTSYPHEILHNWWGNGVYVLREDGNWCEGLTTYCADYAAKEAESDDAAREYRRSNLTGYRDFAEAGGQDFALARFRERDSAATQAVGYGKTMMVFHMLRRREGDDVFWKSLKHLYETKRFTRAGWSDVRASFEAVTGDSLEAWFAEWIDRPGAPEIALAGVEREIGEKSAQVRGAIVQAEPFFSIDVPVVLSRGDDRVREIVAVRGARTEFAIEAPFVPERVAADPDFDLFRRLHAEEVAAALSGVLGAARTRIVIGESEASAVREALAAVAEEWAADSTITIDGDGAADFDGGTWFFGHGAAADAFAKLDLPDAPGDGALVAAGRVGGRVDRPAAVYFPDDATAVADVARKVPHYSKYSWLTFEGSRNVDKGFWKPGASPMTVELGS